MNDTRALYGPVNSNYPPTDEKLSSDEWRLIHRLRQARRIGTSFVLIELSDSLRWRVVGKIEG